VEEAETTASKDSAVMKEPLWENRLTRDATLISKEDVERREAKDNEHIDVHCSRSTSVLRARLRPGTEETYGHASFAAGWQRVTGAEELGCNRR
jgi:anaerobic selenocysteine-containing dehydrogenase